MRIGEERDLGLLQYGDRLLVAHGGEIIQELGEGVSTLQIIDEALDRDTGSEEDGCTAENLRIGVDYGVGLH
jgi:hypothetical protein